MSRPDSSRVYALRQSLHGIDGEVACAAGDQVVRCAPRTVADLGHAVRVAADADATIAVHDGVPVDALADVVIDRAALARVRYVNTDERRAYVEAGARIDDVLRATAAHDLTLATLAALDGTMTVGEAIDRGLLVGPDTEAPLPAPGIERIEIVDSEGARVALATGAVDAAQLHAALSALSADHADALREAAAKGWAPGGYRIADVLPERGPRYQQLPVGARGTLGIVVAATLPLEPLAPARAAVLLGFPKTAEAAAHAPFVVSYAPRTTMLLDASFAPPIDVQPLPIGGAWMLAEFVGDPTSACAAAESLLAAYRTRVETPAGRHVSADDAAHARRALRVAGRGVAVRVPVLDLADFIDDVAARVPAPLRWAADAGAAFAFVDVPGGDTDARAALVDAILTVARRYRAQPNAAVPLPSFECVANAYGPDIAAACATLRAAFDPDRRFRAA